MVAPVNDGGEGKDRREGGGRGGGGGGDREGTTIKNGNQRLSTMIVGNHGNENHYGTEGRDHLPASASRWRGEVL
jgi:hypothetical protein